MAKKTIDGVDVSAKRVLMRVDFNVPLDDDGKITDDRRIAAALPTIRSVLERGGRLVLMSHLGRPKGKANPATSLRPAAIRLGELLGAEVAFAEDCIGPAAVDAAGALADGQCLLLENTRFHAGEEKNDPGMSARLAELGDVYCNDAFGTAHRKHASTYGAAAAMAGKPRVIGFLMRKELQFLREKIASPDRPFIAILGGKKVSDKIPVIERLLEICDTVLIGGAMSYTFFLARGQTVGNSLVEEDKVELAKSLLARAGDKLRLPVDTVVAKELSDDAATRIVEGNVPDGLEGLDIGPKTREAYQEIVLGAGTIVWNGPMGVFEKKPFAGGTEAVAKAVAEATRTGAVSIIGGGDSAAAVEMLGLADDMTHISTGGGASLELLEGRQFECLDILDEE